MVETPRAPSPAHLGVLDGLRGIAIFVVLWYHVWEFNWLPTQFNLLGHDISLQFIPETGFTGVDLFFFISGFVLFYPYVRHVFEKQPLPTVAQFAYRRFIKIVPSYYLQLAVLTPWILAAFSGITLLKVYLTHLLFIHNWFRDTFGSVNGVLWTLAVEVQFYVVFPLLCWCFRRWPLVTFAAMLVVANGYRLALAPCCVADYVRNTQMPAFLDLFACGMLAAWLLVWLRNRMHAPERWHVAWTAAAIVGFALYGWLLYGLFVMRVKPDWQYVWGNGHLTLLGLTFVLLTVASCMASAWWRAVLANPLLVFLSVISYNLYLWHQLIATYFARHAFPFPRTEHFFTDPVWQWTYLALTVTVSIAVASLITYAFERPLLKKGFRAVTDLFTRRMPVPAPSPKTAVVNRYPLDHVDHRVRSIEALRGFYDRLMPALGYTHVDNCGAALEYYCPDEANQFFGLHELTGHAPSDTRIAFAAATRADVDRIGSLLADLGARAIDGPQECPDYIQPYYAVFFEDPEGNKLEVCCRR